MSILLLSLQFLLKTPDVMHVIFLFVNFWVPKLYLCLMFHTFPNSHLDFFRIGIHVLLHGFLIHLPLQTLSHHLVHIVL
jgi:hypothetical protein